MESYPGELLVGVFPLVFCADATLSSKHPAHYPTEDDGQDDAGDALADEAVNDFDNPSLAPTTQPRTKKMIKASGNKSQFDRFLNAIAAALMELDGEDPLLNPKPTNDGAAAAARRKPATGMSLFRGDDDDDDDSDAADDEWLVSSAVGVGAAANTALSVAAYDAGSYVDDASVRSVGLASTVTQGTRQSYRGTPAIGRIGFHSLRNPLRPNSPTNNSVSTSGSNMLSNMMGSRKGASSASVTLLANTSYAKALEHGQGFAQRARIVSISSRHGFPPSKDPTGTENRIHKCFKSEHKALQPTRGSSSTMAATAVGSLDMNKMIAKANTAPIDGILPSGWLEKHAHALPSVLIVVAQVFPAEQQQEQDEHLLETLENLKINLAPKRECQIHIVGVIQKGVGMIQAEQWSQTIASKINSSTGGDGAGAIDNEITLLDVTDDLNPEASSSSAVIQQLHKSVRDASLSYYLNQARRTKLKLQKMGQGSQSKTPLLLPLAIRYCFKVAVFYEFQWKHEKSLKFMAEAYRHVECYYRYLLQLKSVIVGNIASTEQSTREPSGESGEEMNEPIHKPVKVLDSQVTSAASGGTSSSEDDDNYENEDGEGEAVELALSTPRAATQKLDQNAFLSPLPPNDMAHQCRAVADWLNFKLLYSGFVSHTEGGLLAASTQWQKHGHAFCSPRKSFISRAAAAAILSDCDDQAAKKTLEMDLDSTWFDWSYVAHQRVVVSQLLERHPPRALGELGSNHFDEVLLRCSTWKSYEAAAEALLTLGVHVKRAVQKRQGARNKASGGGKLEEQGEMGRFRSRYVGGLDKEGLHPQLLEEAKQNHQGMY
jgi:hypothetical protein